MKQPDNPIRVLRIIARLNVGGPAKHVSLLTKYLAEHGYQSLLLTGRVPAGEGDMAYYAIEHGVEPIYIESMSRELSPKDDLRAVVAIYRHIKRFRPHIVHTHTAKAGTVGRVAAWLAGVPVIIHTYHGHVLSGYFGKLKSYLFLLIERGLGLVSNRLLAVSGKVRQDLLDHRLCSPRKLAVMELGLDLEPFAQAAGSRQLRDELGLPDEASLIGYCGRLTAIKNLPLLLQAFAQIHSQRPTAHLVMIGDGEDRELLEREATAAGLSNVVHFIGFRQDLPGVVGSLDLMLLTSLNEGTPVAVIEANAAAVPAVCTAVGGVPDVVLDGESGWLAPSGDAAAVAAAALAALADPAELRRRGQNAQQRVLERFSFRRLVADIDRLYRELLAGRQLG